MDRILRRQFDAIARDNRSGAAELALRATTALSQWANRSAAPASSELLYLASKIAASQPSMAPLLRLANAAALASEASSPGRAFRRSLRHFDQLLRRAGAGIARHFSQHMRGAASLTVATYSYSSTVLNALIQAKEKILRVYCCESRPALEGQRTAASLASAGIDVVLLTDAAFFDVFVMTDVLVIGADSVQPDGFRNKVGSGSLVDVFSWNGRPTWVLAGTSKFWPEQAFSNSRTLLRSCDGPAREVWDLPPEGVAIWNPYFGPAHYLKGVRVLTERGMMSPARVRREIAKIKLSPRLKELMD